MSRIFYLINEDVSDRPAFIPVEVAILKKLHEKSQELGTKDKMIDFLKKMLKMVGFSTDEATYYYYLFSANYRPDKRYDLITKADITPLTSLRTQKSPNYKMHEFIKSKLPFKGNNIEGFWEKDYNGNSQYVVTSYNWYPILIFKDGTWYKVMDSYSRTTGKQLGQTGIWERTLGKRPLKYLPAGEMKNLRNGKNIQEVEGDALNTLKSRVEEDLKNKTFRFNFDLPNLGFIGKGIYEVGDISFDQNQFKIPVIVKSGVMYGDQGVISDVFGQNSEFKTQLEKEITEKLMIKLNKYFKFSHKILGRDIIIDFDYTKV